MHLVIHQFCSYKLFFLLLKKGVQKVRNLKSFLMFIFA